MTPDQRDTVAQLAARHGVGPGRIESTLDLFVGDVARLFDEPQFQDQLKRAEDAIIAHALNNLDQMDVAPQRTKVEFSQLSHAGRVRRSRQLLAQHIHPSRRWP